MTKKAHPSEVTMLRKLKIAAAVDSLDHLSDEELAQEFAGELVHTSDLMQKRANKSVDRLQRELAAIVQAEQAKLQAHHQQGERVAADHELSNEKNGTKSTLGYAPLPRRLDVGGRKFGLGVATARPREVVLVGELPDKAVALRIGARRLTLVPTKDPQVHRCRDLGEPQLKTLLDAKPAPEIEIILAADKT